MTRFTMVALLSSLSLVACGGHREDPLASTATNYRLCELDLHCPGGMYCSAGVCDHDCTADSDCPSGQGCDLRGRCGDSSAPAAPPKYAGHLVAPPSTLELSAESPSGELTLQNDGVEDIGRFHVISDDPNVTATPSSGPLPSGASVIVTVQVAAGFAGTGATVHILTTGGRADVRVMYGSTLSGRLVGTVDVQAPFELGTAPFAMEISGTPDAMTGAVDGTASLLWPLNASVAATDDGTNFTAKFTFVSAVGAPGNPLFDVPVERTIELVGTHHGATAVAGTYKETIAGLPGGSVVTTGAFQLQQGGKPKGLTPVVAPNFMAGTPGPLPSRCTCTGPGCTGTAVGDANWFFTQGFAFEQWLSLSSYQNGQCLQSSGTLGPCTDNGDISCALGGFIAAGAEDGIVDVWRAQATCALMAGKAQLANVLQPVGASFGNTLTIDKEIPALDGAAGTLTRGLHNALGGGGLLAAANLKLARPGALAQFQQNAGQTSSRDDPALDDVQRFGGAVAARLFAEAEEVDREQRNGVLGSLVMVSAQNMASGALLDLAAIGALLGNPSTVVSGLASSFAPLAGTFEKVEKGFNAAGYPATYVPFAYDPSKPSEDLYQQILELATGYQQAAVADETALNSENQYANGSAAALATQINGIASIEATAITALCGTLPNPPSSTQDCSGQIGADSNAMGAAAAALQEAQGRHSAAVIKLNTLNQQAQQEYADQVDQLAEVIADNNTIELIDAAKAQEAEVNQGFQCVMGILSGGMSANVSGSGAADSVGVSGGGAGSVVSSCLPIVQSLVTSPVSQTEQQDQARADEQVTLMLGSQQVTDNAMVISIQDARADLAAAGSEIAQQTALFDAATQKLADDNAQLARAVENASQSTALAAANPVNDPTFRLLQDADAIQWAADMRLAREWCFLTAQDLAYLLDQSRPESGQCLQDETAGAVAGTFTAMKDARDYDEVQHSTYQERRDEISLRADVFGITKSRTDPVTGATLTPTQQFQAMLALPANRDAAGNLQLKFATSVGAGNGIFSTDVGVDLINTVEANLSSSALAGPTAYLSVTQSGSGSLRSYLDGSVSQKLLDPKTALVPASINNTSFSDPTITPSSDLFGRPVADSGWTLTLSADDPRNQDVIAGLTDIEDITLLIDHRARTIQSAP